MPELPEVETMCRGIRPIIGRAVATVGTPRCRYRPIVITPKIATIRRRLQGRRVSDITRLGKRVLIHVDEDALILQPKMTGLVCLGAPPDPEHVRLEVTFRGSPKIQLLFWDRRGLGTVELLPANQIHQRIVAGRLGPDALAISPQDFSGRLARTQRPIKVALLDQKLLAGVGNLYASEMLHIAGIHPAKPSARLSAKKKRRLYEAMQNVLWTAIEHEGSTLSDGTYRNALNDPGEYQNHHLVYDRAGLACPSCSQGTICRIVQAQRSTFFCPRCQRS